MLGEMHLTGPLTLLLEQNPKIPVLQSLGSALDPGNSPQKERNTHRKGENTHSQKGGEYSLTKRRRTLTNLWFEAVAVG